MQPESSEILKQGNLLAYEDAIFLNAEHFRLQRFKGRGGQDRARCASFTEAMILADDALRGGYRVLVYAVTDKGRFTALPRNRWNHFAELELARRAA